MEIDRLSIDLELMASLITITVLYYESLLNFPAFMISRRTPTVR